ncbi:hypothetical protein PVAP13_1NG285400 [Panicum virgatum]|uniref:Uncharacterized protein n=1 Tax=Panicum virgatum TaxID=38727 RepID=A0A8T0WW32_PANVG|nr:hypothetical protein PVAP13_1NG285400 [Panicum virgatum]
MGPPLPSLREHWLYLAYLFSSATHQLSSLSLSFFFFLPPAAHMSALPLISLQDMVLLSPSFPAEHGHARAMLGLRAGRAGTPGGGARRGSKAAAQAWTPAAPDWQLAAARGPGLAARGGPRPGRGAAAHSAARGGRPSARRPRSAADLAGGPWTAAAADLGGPWRGDHGRRPLDGGSGRTLAWQMALGQRAATDHGRRRTTVTGGLRRSARRAGARYRRRRRGHGLLQAAPADASATRARPAGRFFNFLFYL